MNSHAFASGFGRPIDWRYASNRFAIATWVVSLAVYLALAWWDERFTYLGAVAASVAVFLAWTIGRELDPGHTSVAGLAAMGSFGVVFIGAPAALVVFGALIAVRAVAGTTGRAMRWGDLAALGAAGFASGGAVWSWSIAIVLFAWLKAGPHVGPRRWWGVVALGVGFVAGWYFGELDPIVFSAESALLAVGVVVVTMLAMVTVSTPGRTDSGKTDISATRVRLARGAAGAVCFSAVVLGGRDALIQVGPVSCVLVATAVVVVATLGRKESAVPEQADPEEGGGG